jgi:exopolysaccharide biosynthesis polyprenyl glycosylphosphotransferase
MRDTSSILEELPGKIPVKHVSEGWLQSFYLNQENLYSRCIKRIVDDVLSLLILLAASPIMLITAVAIKLDGDGPVFYRQRRVGKDGNEFELIKFRSMVKDAEKETGPVWANEKDSRVTSVGRIIRPLGIDELPQLLNVIKGEMSLVGPRPERPEFVADFIGRSQKKDLIIPFYMRRLSVKPGVTGWAQVMYPYASSYEQTLEKLGYDFYYIKNMSFLIDLRILLKTIRVLLFGRSPK